MDRHARWLGTTSSASRGQASELTEHTWSLARPWRRPPRSSRRREDHAVPHRKGPRTAADGPVRHRHNEGVEGPSLQGPVVLILHRSRPSVLCGVRPSIAFYRFSCSLSLLVPPKPCASTIAG